MTIRSEPIAVIGAGSWGTALALLLARNGNPVRLWGNEPERQRAMQVDRVNARYLPGEVFPENLRVDLTLEACVEGVEDVLVVVPSHAFRSVLQQLKPLVSPSVRIVWGSKGLDPQTKHVLYDVVQAVFSDQTPAVVLAGPSFAAEVAAGLPTAVSVAGNNPEFLQDCIDRFHNDRFRLYVNDDMLGVQLCGALKNILAIAVGIADGLSLGANARAALITRGLAEMTRLNLALGGQERTLMGLAGIGDLVLTCTDNQSRNRRFGLALGQGLDAETAKQHIGQEIEGATNTQQVYALAHSLNVEMPITENVYRILHEGAAPMDVLAELLSRGLKHECNE